MITDWLEFSEPAAHREDGGPSLDNKYFHINLQLPTHRERKADLSDRYRRARCDDPNPAGRSLIDWGSWTSAAPGEDKAASPDHKSFHTSTTPTNRRRKRWPPGLIPPSTLWNPLPHWLIADWPKLVEPPPGNNMIPSPDHKFFYTCANPTHRG